MSVIKILQGTRPDGRPLCHTCRSGHVMRGPAESQEIIRCQYTEETIPFPVVECSNYYPKNKPGLHQYEELAWILSTNNKRKIGFIPARQWKARSENQYEEMCPDSD